MTADLRAALAEFYHSTRTEGDCIHFDGGTTPECIAFAETFAANNPALATPEPAPVAEGLDVEDEGITQRAHVACCWCDEHHEEGK